MSVYAQVYEIVRKIPRGRVLTYGLIANVMGGRLSAQGVGWALKALPGPAKTVKKKPVSTKKPSEYDAVNVPWQRVINSKGSTSTHKIGTIPPGLQQALLEAEGLIFNDAGEVELTKYLWIEFLVDNHLSGE